MTTPFTPEIKAFPKTLIVGLERTFERQTLAQIPDLWKGFHGRYEEIPHRTGIACYGVSVLCDRENLTIDYLAAEEVSQVSALPAQMTDREIGGGLAAVFTLVLKGRSIGAEIGAAFDEIWRLWMPASDYVPNGGYEFERYDRRFDPKTLSGAIELVIPVAPRPAPGA